MREDEALEAAAVQSLGTGTFRPRRFGVRAFRETHVAVALGYRSAGSAA